jgi:hypothetical protein
MDIEGYGLNKDDFYIQVLKFAASKAPTGFKHIEYREWAAEEFESFENNPILLNILNETCEMRDSFYNLKPDYYLGLLQHKAIMKAEEDASWAGKLSIFAICISILSFGLTGWSLYASGNPVKIDNAQVSRMETKEAPISQKVESEQLTQVIEALKQSNINTAELTKMIREQKGVAAEVK